jgi:hypothetical protein
MELSGAAIAGWAVAIVRVIPAAAVCKKPRRELLLLEAGADQALVDSNRAAVQRTISARLLAKDLISVLIIA